MYSEEAAKAASADSCISSATPSSWVSSDGIQLRKSVSVRAAAGPHVEGAVGFGVFFGDAGLRSDPFFL